LLVGALSEMIKTLITALPTGAFEANIFKMAMILIEANMNKKPDLVVLRLYHFISMEFHDKLGLDKEMSSLFTRNFITLKDDLELQNIPYILLIIEEHILINFVPYH
jgi:hypothetical protein